MRYESALVLLSHTLFKRLPESWLLLIRGGKYVSMTHWIDEDVFPTQTEELFERGLFASNVPALIPVGMSWVMYPFVIVAFTVKIWELECDEPRNTQAMSFPL